MHELDKYSPGVLLSSGWATQEAQRAMGACCASAGDVWPSHANANVASSSALPSIMSLPLLSTALLSTASPVLCTALDAQAAHVAIA